MDKICNHIISLQDIDQWNTDEVVDFCKKILSNKDLKDIYEVVNASSRNWNIFIFLLEKIEKKRGYRAKREAEIALSKIFKLKWSMSYR